MKNLWQEKDAALWSVDQDLGLRVYSSRLLGQNPDLVLHGGGNTSVKGSAVNVFAESLPVLRVKGSGWDLRSIQAPGFPAVSLDYLLKLGTIESLSDQEMMRQLRLALLDPTAPTPSVEAILHALVPHRYVDHSHADAVVAISNTPQGEALLAKIYGSEVLILPYVMPGFILAQQVANATRNVDWHKLRGILLMHHGLFTFNGDAKESYDTMIELVSRAEDYLVSSGAAAAIARANYQPGAADYLQLSKLRRAAAELFAAPVLLRWDYSAEAVGFASLPKVADLVTRGPLTPDHTIHTKAFAAIFDADPLPGLTQFTEQYRRYFDEHAKPEHQCLDLMPRFGVWLGKGMVSLAANLARLQIVRDISAHTIKAIQWGEALGGWTALPQQDLFDVEYWELEQAKLKSGKTAAEFEGKVAVVSGAASGIGLACVEEMLRRGAVVLALDISAELAKVFADQPAVLAIHCDVTDSNAIDRALQQCIASFGGIDVLISNAGNFPDSLPITNMTDAAWDQSMALNMTSHMKVLRACLPYLRNGIDPAVVIIASKNVPAPGPGAAAYSAAKAGLTQMARVAALELGEAGIRVNVLHPNAVFDTAIWTDEVLASRAASYGLSVQDYRRRNVLNTEVTSRDVALMAALFAGRATSRTTGAQIPVDGGNERVI